MKKAWKQVVFAIFMGFIVPWCMFMLAVPDMPMEEITIDTTPSAQGDMPGFAGKSVNVFHRGQTCTMGLDAYLTGVLLQELPGNFHIEAKKAQAVVARTYTLRTAYMKNKHPENAVCTDSTCCQGYITPDEYLANGGTIAVVEAAQKAVQETQNLVITYAGELIDATYFSCSGGTTEDAVAVWGSDVPYLQSVDSPGEEMAAHYTDTVTFTLKQFQMLLGVRLTGDPNQWIGQAKHTDGGGVASIVVGGKVFTGTQVRSMLGLRSTAFTISVVGSDIEITTKGFGHRVGMSQYGAEAMALAGKDFHQILLHYYAGTQLESM